MRLRLSHLILLYLCCIGFSYSQVRFGATIGGNSSSLIGDTPSDAVFTSKTGYSAGLNLDVFLLDDVSIFIQSIYSKRNTALQYDVDYQYEPYDSLDFSIDYLEIPISVKVTAGNNIAYVIAGLSLNMTLAATTHENPSSTETDIIDSIEPFSVNANFGVGVQFQIGKPYLFFEFRYSQGLTNLVNSSSNEVQYLERLKSNSIQLLTGIMFNL